MPHKPPESQNLTPRALSDKLFFVSELSTPYFELPKLNLELPEGFQSTTDAKKKHPIAVERCITTVLFLLQSHQSQITSSSNASALRTTLHWLHKCMRPRLEEQRDCVGTNLAGLRFVRQAVARTASSKTFVG